MAINKEKYLEIKGRLGDKATLVAVSKFKPIEDIQALYDMGQRDFGENFVQELILKYEAMPKDIRWHFIGHLQSNKVKYIAPFVHLIHGVDTEKLLTEINKQGAKINRVIDCLLQVHIAEEETKFGFSEEELGAILIKLKEEKNFANVNIRGLMGMASFTEDQDKISKEFRRLKNIFDKTQSALAVPTSSFNINSTGMSADYEIALAEGSTMTRIGSLLFGQRNPAS
jgi:hypothetical protein